MSDAQERLWSLSLPECLQLYDRTWDKGYPAIAELARHDRFFLLVYVLRRKDACRQWIFDRCREVERAPEGFVDIWAREHYKSTVITFAGIIQEIVRDPEVTVGIFSYNYKEAKKFLTQIKYELESNEILQACYPEILYKNPRRDARRWSEDGGIVVKRKGNPREATLEAHGLVDNMPTGMHYALRVYDDVVTDDTVRTPEMIEKVTDRWRMSVNLGREGGRAWVIGTFYHFNDTYRTMISEGVAKPRIYSCTVEGEWPGTPVLQSNEYIENKRRAMGPYIFGAQMLCDPTADNKQGFKEEWLKFHEGISDSGGMNKYLVVDPANEKKKHSDFTAMWVVGLNADRNYYVLDMVRDRLNLSERWEIMLSLHRRWKPNLVGYEKYGKDADIQHFEDKMKQVNYRFHIQALGGSMKKEDRIRRLIPVFEQGRMFLPEVLWRDNYEGKKQDLVNIFVEQEFKGFPVSQHDDMLDALARIRDPDLPTSWPDGSHEEEEPVRRRYEGKPKRRTTWMAA